MSHRLTLSLFLAFASSLPVLAQSAGQHGPLVSNGDTWMQGPSITSLFRWNGSRFVGCDPCQAKSPVLFSVDSQGNREEIIFSLPGAGFVGALDYAAGRDGALVVVGYAVNNVPQTAFFIAWISPDRKRQIVTETWPYYPRIVTVGPDGTIWTMGQVKRDTSMAPLHYNVLRHYDPSGKLLAAAHGLAHLRKFNNDMWDVADGGSLDGVTRPHRISDPRLRLC